MTEKDVSEIENYITTKEPEVQKLLQAVRQVIRKAAPEAEEKMGYGVPGFYLNGPLVYYAAFKKHLGFYPTPSGIMKFKKELAQYKTAKGTVQFSFNKPIPLELIIKIVKFRVDENNKKRK